jgi:hypothetical protein
MPIIDNPFNGKMNLDVADYRIGNGDYIDALNITKDAQGKGQDMVVSNIVGNTLIPYTLPSGTNKVIGFYGDKVRNRAYYCIWNSNGYNTIAYNDLSTNIVYKVFQSITDSSGVDILAWNPSYKIVHINIVYRDGEGDLFFFNDGLNEPRGINIDAAFSPNWTAEYMSVIKAPPKMPCRVVYENDTTVIVNNLRNSLFQFRYRFVYDDYERSVWSSASILPLPYQPSNSLTFDGVDGFGNPNYTSNSRITLFFSTGNKQVAAIELAFRQFKNDYTSDWMLIEKIDKALNGIVDNDISTYRFYNDSNYTPIDILDTTEIQDWVPQAANAQELINGNTLIYGGITEGYDKVLTNMTITTYENTSGFFYDYNGLLFFASINGNSSGEVGRTMKIFLYGMGDNLSTTGEVYNLRNGIVTFALNVINGSGTQIGFTVSGLPVIGYALSVATALTAFSTALIANGWTVYASTSNTLTASYPTDVTLQSSGVQYVSTTNNITSTSLVDIFQASYDTAVMYFDTKGRTNGALTNTSSSFTVPANYALVPFAQPRLKISHRPPKWASYYQILRSPNKTYAKLLNWISQGVYNNGVTTTTRFAYIGIDNITDYNLEISSTANVVSYTYQQGDRIRFLSRYTSTGEVALSASCDFEIIGVESGPVINGVLKDGMYVKMYYPTSTVDPNLILDGTADNQNYKIILYSYAQKTPTSSEVYYEFGKYFGIGNPGTNSAYHMGLNQSQSATDPSGVPALIDIVNGDYFYRNRTVPYGPKFNLQAGGQQMDIGTTMVINYNNITGVIQETAAYKIQTEYPQLVSMSPGSYPTWSYSDQFFYNKLTGTDQTTKLKLKGSFTAIQTDVSHGDTTFQCYAIICTTTSKTSVSLINPSTVIMTYSKSYTFDIDIVLDVPPTGKIWIALVPDNTAIGETFVVNSFPLVADIVQQKTIPIIEQSFSDTVNLVGNSDGRPSVVDPIAANVYFPTLVRFGSSFQADTAINGINRFSFSSSDTYDRGFGDVMRLHVRDRYMHVYQKLKVGNVPLLTQIVKDVQGNPLQANTDQLINKIQYYAGDYGIGDAITSLAWNNFADYFVDNYRGVVCRLSQDGIVPISILNHTNAFFVPLLMNYRQELNNGSINTTGNPCIYGVFDAYTNKYIIAMEEINRYSSDCSLAGTASNQGTTTTTSTSTTSTTSTTTTSTTSTTTTTSTPICTLAGNAINV